MNLRTQKRLEKRKHKDLYGPTEYQMSSPFNCSVGFTTFTTPEKASELPNCPSRTNKILQNFWLALVNTFFLFGIWLVSNVTIPHLPRTYIF